jgi:polyphosphate glucokinase
MYSLSKWVDPREDPCYQNKKNRSSFHPAPHWPPNRWLAGVKKLAGNWKYNAVSIGYPGPVIGNRPLAEPHNLGRGWMGFDFKKACKRPVKVVNDAAMQPLGSYNGGKMLFLGLGTGLVSIMNVKGEVEVVNGQVLKYFDKTLEDRAGHQ